MEALLQEENPENNGATGLASVIFVKYTKKNVPLIGTGSFLRMKLSEFVNAESGKGESSW